MMFGNSRSFAEHYPRMTLLSDGSVKSEKAASTSVMLRRLVQGVYSL